ncbi:MAG: hypothetical protein AB7O21_02135 [Gammaproteobacteria bacterium]
MITEFGAGSSGERRLRTGLRVLAALGVLGGVFGGILVFGTAPWRYAEYPCQYALIYGERGPVDLAIVGSSRSVLGVGAAEIAEVLRPTAGREVVVYDLSKSWRGEGMNYTFVRDLLDNRQVRHLLVEANLPEAGSYHAHWYLAARYEDLVRNIAFEQRHGFALRPIARAARMVADRLVDRVARYLTGEVRPAPLASSSRPAATKDCMVREEPVKPDALAARAAAHAKYYRGQVWHWDMESRDALHDTGFYGALVSLASSRGVTLHFYYVHERHYSRLDPAFASAFQQTTGAPLLIPPDDLVDRLEADGYADPTHMNPHGRALYSAWLAKRLISELNGKI